MRAATVSQRALARRRARPRPGQLRAAGQGRAVAPAGADKDSILSDTLEAVFGAVYLTHGLETARAARRAAGRSVAGRRGGPRCRPRLEDVAAGAVRGPGPRCAELRRRPARAPTTPARSRRARSSPVSRAASASARPRSSPSRTPPRTPTGCSRARSCSPDVPELPEVETVRDGLARHVLGRTVTGVEVRRDYSVRRHVGGPLDFAGRLRGRRLDAAVRRGKFLWLLLDDGRRRPDGAPRHERAAAGPRTASRERPEHPHLRVRLDLDDGSALDFVDQRTFGHLSVPDLVPTPDGAPGGLGSPAAGRPGARRAHRPRPARPGARPRRRWSRRSAGARPASSARCSTRRVVSGIGNIYADEGLWRAQLHYARPDGDAAPVPRSSARSTARAR